MSVREVDTLQPETQFALIGQAKKAMNSYIREFYQDQDGSGFKVSDTYQDKENAKMMAKIRQIIKTTDVVGSTRNSALKRQSPPTYDTPIKGVSSRERHTNPNVNEVVHNQKSF